MHESRRTYDDGDIECGKRLQASINLRGFTSPNNPMARLRSPWPRGLRIDRRNDALAALPDEHPAKRVLILRAECQRDCASREIAWPGREHEAVDQTWNSKIRVVRCHFPDSSISSYASI